MLREVFENCRYLWSVVQNSDMFWKPTQALLGDVATAIVSFAQGLKGYKCDPQWLSDLRQRDDNKEASNRSANTFCTSHRSVNTFSTSDMSVNTFSTSDRSVNTFCTSDRSVSSVFMLSQLGELFV